MSGNENKHMMKKKSIKQVFYPFQHGNFQKGIYSEFLPKCCKLALFALQFSKFQGGGVPRTPPPPETFRLERLLCRYLLFHKISLVSLKLGLPALASKAVMLRLAYHCVNSFALRARSILNLDLSGVHLTKSQDCHVLLFGTM